MTTKGGAFAPLIDHRGKSPLSRSGKRSSWMRLGKTIVLSTLMAMGLSHQASASTAYGSINNFDCVNDTGVEAHGFEIELDYGHSKDISYTYDYNHYGVPKISEDLTDPGHPKVFVRYASAKRANGTWASYTAIPSGPIAPTMGHQFTNPAVNFGGEHFGVGFMGTPVAVKYNWLIDDGVGNLKHGPAVYISTPAFTYVPPAAGVPANVVAVIAPPPPPAPPVFQFGVASWVKEIKTHSHNTHKVSLNQLVGDDPGHVQPWANGEKAEVEVEWRVMQTQFANANGGKFGQLQGAAENLPGGKEMITRRYEFYKYVGPVDAETGEAMGDTVGPDGIHGIGTVTYADHFDPTIGEWVTITVDMSKIVVVGDFFGTQMAGFDVAPNLGLIDHIQNGDASVAFPNRTVVIGSGSPFLAKVKSGALPTGLTLAPASGILSGTPTAVGNFTFTVQASDLSGALVSKTYTVSISGITITTSASPSAGGTIVGNGAYKVGNSVTLQSKPNAGYYLVSWTEGATVVSSATNYTFIASVNRTLVANFAKLLTITSASTPSIGGTTSGGGSFKNGANATLKATSNAGYVFVNWTEGTTAVSTNSSYSFKVSANRTLVANFAKLYTITSSSSPAVAGTTTGGGSFKSGTSVMLKAAANTGYSFVNWTEGTTVVGSTPSYTFNATLNRTLVANFKKG